MRLLQDVTCIKGIGEETAKELALLGIRTVKDLLEHYPFRYEDYRIKELHEVKHDERVTIAGVIHSEPAIRFFGKKKSRISYRMLVGNVLITVVFFNQPFVKRGIQVGDSLTVTGKWDQHRITLTASEFKKGISSNDNEASPVYSVGGNISVKQMKKYISLALKEFAEHIEDILPTELIQKYKLLSKRDAVFALHYPKDKDALKMARRTIVYEEFLLFQLKMQAFRKTTREQSVGRRMMIPENAVKEFVSSLPFPLTNAQYRVIGEIFADLGSPYRMNRLLQGDVGSGKTVVAAISIYGAFKSGYQSALMVPTEILAEQHFVSLTELLEAFGVSVMLLSGSVKGKKRREQLALLQEGKIDLVVGTHALIQEDVSFGRLGLVITDEQHRFGVEQRRVLRDKGENPDVLFMTATPIPRTLAISVFGDMDVSIIDELPAGRKTIETYWAKHGMLDRVLDFVGKELTKGRQAYVICPLIEESEKLDVQNAIDVHSLLQRHFHKYRVGLMHGRLHPTEKDAIMNAFSKNEVQMLVSTTVVEVGVNVPNASIMVIYDAERFGLAQLHQLRGRVGRGEFQSYCILLADPKSEVGKERMRIMTETNDGFLLSERDLELRGPGDFFGSKQSGIPHFKLADVVHDYRALEVARQDAVSLIGSNAFWEGNKYQTLRTFLASEGVLNGEKLD